jgi:hypothetical protein
MTTQMLRKLHLWLGVFFAPSLIFFCLTGALMTFRLQERLPGGDPAPAWLSLAGRVHMSESLTPKPPKAPTPSPTPSAGNSTVDSAPALSPTPARRPPSIPMKIFAALMALGIIITTILGVVMAFRFNRDPKLLWGLLAAGTVLPVILVLL